MLQPNRLDPPRPFLPHFAPAARPAPATGRVFVSPEDFDATGILAGCDPCASSYWWMPELHADGAIAQASPAPSVAAGTHATRRPASPAQAAA